MADGITDEVRRAGWDAYVAAIEGGYDSPQVYAQTLEAIVSAFVAGRAVVDLPEPDRLEENIALRVDPPLLASTWGVDGWKVYAWIKNGQAHVEVAEFWPEQDANVEAMRRRFAVGLAACAEAERLAAGSSSGAAGGVL